MSYLALNFSKNINNQIRNFDKTFCIDESDGFYPELPKGKIYSLDDSDLILVPQGNHVFDVYAPKIISNWLYPGIQWFNIGNSFIDRSCQLKELKLPKSPADAFSKLFKNKQFKKNDGKQQILDLALHLNEKYDEVGMGFANKFIDFNDESGKVEEFPTCEVKLSDCNVKLYHNFEALIIVYTQYQPEYNWYFMLSQPDVIKRIIKRNVTERSNMNKLNLHAFNVLAQQFEPNLGTYNDYIDPITFVDLPSHNGFVFEAKGGSGKLYRHDVPEYDADEKERLSFEFKNGTLTFDKCSSNVSSLMEISFFHNDELMLNYDALEFNYTCFHTENNVVKPIIRKFEESDIVDI